MKKQYKTCKATLKIINFKLNYKQVIKLIILIVVNIKFEILFKHRINVLKLFINLRIIKC